MQARGLWPSMGNQPQAHLVLPFQKPTWLILGLLIAPSSKPYLHVAWLRARH